MTTTAETIGPPRTSVGALGWLKRNLFSPWYNALLSLISVWLIYSVGGQTVQWALTARWEVITSNLRLFMVGSFPPDQVWRVWLVVTLASLLAGMSGGIGGRTARNIVFSLAASFGLFGVLSLAGGGYEWHFANVLAIGAGYLLTRGRAQWGRWVALAWLLAFFLTLFILYGIEKNEWLPLIGTDRWGGLLLTFLLSIVGIVFSFPLGVLLALGRRSRMPMISLFSTLYIEIVRGVPLVTVLFIAQIMVPLFLPEEMRLDRIMRAMAGVTLFAAAYMAENVRGGLQAVPSGQVEAAHALGLSDTLVTVFIVLPQALRVVIPPIVSLFIGLFKDTTLVAIVGLLDLLAVGKSVLAQPEFLGLQKEVYVFVAGVFFIFCYVMSYASYRLEIALGVGKR
ncbi:MAG: ABC transporter permease subunit [Chloroflexi bacterium]|nr:ABC transporter permease subunit [Chloroflexota bacterium]